MKIPIEEAEIAVKVIWAFASSVAIYFGRYRKGDINVLGFRKKK